MIERFLLDGVDGQRTRFGIDLADECAIVIATTATEARLPIGYATMMRTEQTLHSLLEGIRNPRLQTFIISTLHQNTIAS